MGFGKSFKKIAVGAGKVVGNLTGSDKAGAVTAGVVGSTFWVGGPASYSQYMRDTKKTPTEDLTLKETQAQLALAQQQALLSQEDLKRIEEEKKRQTTFAGSSLQNIIERRKLGV